MSQNPAPVTTTAPASGADAITEFLDPQSGAFHVTATLTFPDGTVGYLDHVFTTYQYQLFLAFLQKYVLPAQMLDSAAGWTERDVARMIADLHIPLIWQGPVAAPPPPPTPNAVPGITN